MGNLNNIAFAATSLVGGILAVWGRFDIGSLAAFLQYSRQVGFPVQQITNQFNTVLAALAGAERVFDMMDEEPEVDEGTVALVGATMGADGALTVSRNGGHAEHWVWQSPRPDGSLSYVELKGDIRFNDVTFGYEADKTVLHDISLYAKPGQKIALVGSTGAGQDHHHEPDQPLLRYRPGLHHLRWHRHHGRSSKDSLRRSIGMVLQDTHLFTGTVMDNIRYGRLEATDAECVQAAKQANAHSFIKRLPKGYDTMITADGANLSQGQRQLLAIARTAVADPPVMILDEATSSIDTRTERLIEKGMDALMQGPDRVGHRAPALDGPQRRRHHRDRRRPDHRARQPRRSAEPARQVLPVVHGPVRAHVRRGSGTAKGGGTARSTRSACSVRFRELRRSRTTGAILHFALY